MQDPTPVQPVLQQQVQTPKEFIEFANDHYDDMQKAGQKSNSYKLHSCCFTFSSKSKRPDLGHPTKAVTFRRLAEDHDVKSPEDFAGLLFRLSLDRRDEKAGQLPTVNLPHPKPIDLGKRQPELPPAEDLQLRVKQLELENKQLRSYLKVAENESKQFLKDLQAAGAEYNQMFTLINNLRMQLVLAKGHQRFNNVCYNYFMNRLPRALSTPELQMIQSKASTQAAKETELELRRHLQPYPSTEVWNMSHCPETLVVGQDLGCAACRATVRLPGGEDTETPSEGESAEQSEPKHVADILSLTSKATLKQ